MNTSTSCGDRARLTELKHFLRARRALLAPADVGLKPGGRRRTPGLRRDEVALLAGIGATWYTFLEQGRDVRVSVRVLRRLSTVFGLSPAERSYLFQLALVTLPETRPARPASDRALDTFRRIIEQFDPNPAYLLDQRFDMIACNSSASLVFDYSDATPPTQNILRRVVTDSARMLYKQNYDPLLRSMIAAFRPHFSRHADDPVLIELVAELEAASPEFRKWWLQHEVQADAPQPMMLTIDHPSLGVLRGRFTFLSLFGWPNFLIPVFTPEPNTGTEEVIRKRLALIQSARV